MLRDKCTRLVNCAKSGIGAPLAEYSLQAETTLFHPMSQFLRRGKIRQLYCAGKTGTKNRIDGNVSRSGKLDQTGEQLQEKTLILT